MPRDGIYIMVLEDGETYTSVAGCEIRFLDEMGQEYVDSGADLKENSDPIIKFEEIE